MTIEAISRSELTLALGVAAPATRTAARAAGARAGAAVAPYVAPDGALPGAPSAATRAAWAARLSPGAPLSSTPVPIVMATPPTGERDSN